MWEVSTHQVEIQKIPQQYRNRTLQPCNDKMQRKNDDKVCDGKTFVSNEDVLYLYIKTEII